MAGTPVTTENGKLNIPNDPVIHYIEGDGIGVDITPVMIKVVDASVANQLLKTFHFDADNSALIDSTMEPVLVCAKHSVTEEPLQFWFQRSTLEGENPS